MLVQLAIRDIVLIDRLELIIWLQSPYRCHTNEDASHATGLL